MTTLPIDTSIEYIKATENPLSADVGIIKGEKFIWLYDVGSSDEAAEYINGLAQPTAVVLSHFHPDHTHNLSRVKHEELYVGDNTYGYTHEGTVVTEDIYIEDGVKLHIFPLPSSHARGSLGLEINEKYAFVGDGTYATRKGGRTVYNVQFLKAMIDVIKGLKAEFILLSHEEKLVKRRDTLLVFLQSIYDMRKAGEAYIEV